MEVYECSMTFNMSISMSVPFHCACMWFMKCQVTLSPRITNNDNNNNNDNNKVCDLQFVQKLLECWQFIQQNIAHI